jgi:toxin-antitoxin system, antitoxin component, xre family
MHRPEVINIKDRVKAVRKALGLSQEQFANAVNITKNYVSLVETGARTLSRNTMEIVCQKFNVRIEWLRDGTGEMFRQDQADDISKVADRYGLTDQERAMIEQFVRLPKSKRAVLLEYIENVANNIDGGPNDKKESSTSTKNEAEPRMFTSNAAAHRRGILPPKSIPYEDALAAEAEFAKISAEDGDDL